MGEITAKQGRIEQVNFDDCSVAFIKAKAKRLYAWLPEGG